MFDLGDTVPLTVEVRDGAGALTVPGSAVWTVTLPDGTTVVPPLSNPSLGLYAADYVPTTAGRHVARFVSTNPSAAFVDEFDVAPAASVGILSLSTAKAALNITDSSNDEEIRAMVEAVTGLIEGYRGEVVVRRAITEMISIRDDSTSARRSEIYSYAGRTANRLVLRHRPVLSVTSVVRPYDGATWSSSDLVLTDPTSGMVTTYGTPFYGEVVVTYTAGYTIIPATFTEAAKIILRHLWQVQQTPGMGGNVFGAPDDTASVVGAGYALPNRAAELLGGRMPTVA